jgi:biopolymer transport protein ExbB/biopolymer transport protein TolQ
MSFQAMLGDIGFVGFVVMGCLVALSIYSVSVSIDKLRRLRRAARESAEFLPAFSRLLEEGELKQAVLAAQRHERSHVARVVSAGVAELLDGKSALSGADRLELVHRALERSSVLTVAEMRRGLGGLATIGSTAPFIGLFGTVVGIIHAFEGIAATGSGGIAAVSGGIAEALVATALGILVAIPSVMAFNYFTGTIERFHVEMSTTAAQLVDWLRKREALHAAAR